MPPFGEDPNAGAVPLVPNIDGELGFAPKLKGEDDAALEPPKANAPVEVVGEAALDAPNAKAPVEVVGDAALDDPKANAPVEVVGDAALDAPNAKAPVEVVGDAPVDAPKAKGLPDPAEAPNANEAGEDEDPALPEAPKPKTGGDCEGCADTSELKPPKPDVLGALDTPNAGVLEAPNAGVLEAPNAGVLEAPNAGVLEAPKAGVLEVPNAEALEVENVAVLEGPNAGVLDAPKVGMLEAPKAGVLDAPKAGVLEAPNAGALEAPPNKGAGLLDPNVELPKREEDNPKPALTDDGEVVEATGVESKEAGFKPNKGADLDAGAGELAPTPNVGVENTCVDGVEAEVVAAADNPNVTGAVTDPSLAFSGLCPNATF